jgi:hypothetical protein
MSIEWTVIKKQVFNNNPQGSRLRGRQKKTGGGIMYRQIIIITAKLTFWRRNFVFFLTLAHPVCKM